MSFERYLSLVYKEINCYNVGERESERSEIQGLISRIIFVEFEFDIYI